MDVLFPVFCILLASFPLERNSDFLCSKRIDIIPFLWNVFLQNSCENPLNQTGPYQRNTTYLFASYLSLPGTSSNGHSSQQITTFSIYVGIKNISPNFFRNTLQTQILTNTRTLTPMNTRTQPGKYEHQQWRI